MGEGAVFDGVDFGDEAKEQFTHKKTEKGKVQMKGKKLTTQINEGEERAIVDNAKMMLRRARSTTERTQSTCLPLLTYLLVNFTLIFFC